MISIHGKQASLSLAHKRWSQNEAGKVVVDRVHCIGFDDFDISEETTVTFLNSLAISKQTKYQLIFSVPGLAGLHSCIRSRKITGNLLFLFQVNAQRNYEKRLTTFEQLNKNIETLKSEAKREKQVNRRVELNLKLKQLQVDLADTRKIL